mmetsp:Transcript_67149/g.180393  ORF Transcript_67149/g.180393 Transcript_67149/m.180393 type:complete len:269 (-) Transcript_67149:1445-2251(-)
MQWGLAFVQTLRIDLAILCVDVSPEYGPASARQDPEAKPREVQVAAAVVGGDIHDEDEERVGSLLAHMRAQAVGLLVGVHMGTVELPRSVLHELKGLDVRDIDANGSGTDFGDLLSGLELRQDVELQTSFLKLFKITAKQHRPMHCARMGGAATILNLLPGPRGLQARLKSASGLAKLHQPPQLLPAEELVEQPHVELALAGDPPKAGSLPPLSDIHMPRHWRQGQRPAIAQENGRATLGTHCRRCCCEASTNKSFTLAAPGSKHGHR